MTPRPLDSKLPNPAGGSGPIRIKSGLVRSASSKGALAVPRASDMGVERHQRYVNPANSLLGAVFLRVDLASDVC